MSTPEENPYAARRRALPRRLLGLLAGMMIRPLLVRLLEYQKMREFVMLHLSNKLAMQQASFARDLPRSLESIQGFEDCYWLFSSNKLNHGLLRLEFAEAAFVYRLVRSMNAPRVVELGRYKGGGTFLLAVAGARVLSLDNDKLPGQCDYMTQLEQALARFRLDERVENVLADALTYPIEPESADLVIVDLGGTAPLVKGAFEHWWPAVKPGGYLLFADGKNTPLVDVGEYVAALRLEEYGARRVADTPGAFEVLQKLPRETHT